MSNLFQSSSLSDERSLGLEDYQSTAQTQYAKIKKLNDADYEVSVAILKMYKKFNDK